MREVLLLIVGYPKPELLEESGDLGRAIESRAFQIGSDRFTDDFVDRFCAMLSQLAKLKLLGPAEATH